jgi:hypothetical protein
MDDPSTDDESRFLRRMGRSPSPIDTDFALSIRTIRDKLSCTPPALTKSPPCDRLPLHRADDGERSGSASAVCRRCRGGVARLGQRRHRVALGSPRRCAVSRVHRRAANSRDVGGVQFPSISVPEVDLSGESKEEGRWTPQTKLLLVAVVLVLGGTFLLTALFLLGAWLFRS